MSNKIQKTIEINAKVKASLEGMEKTVGELERGLEKQKFDLSKNSGLSKLIKDYKAAKAELDELMSGDVIARTDIKKAEQLGGKVSKLYKQIGKSFEDLRAGSDDTFRKLFPDSFAVKISKGTKAIENFFSKLDSKTVKEGRLDEARKDLTRLNDELDVLKNRRLKIEVDIDKKGVKDELDRINKDLEQMRENFKKKLIPEEKRDSQGRTQTERLNSSVSTWSNKLAQDTDARKNLKVQSLSKSQSSQISKLEGQLVDARGANLADIEKKRLDALYAEQTKRATIAKTPGARDTSRNRREYGGVTDKELAAQIAASEKELQRLRAIADKIDDIKQQPQRAYDAAVKKLETQIKTDRTNLEKAERALEAHTTQRENQEAAASQKADDFIAGKQVAEATQAEIDVLKALNDEKQKNLDLEKKLKEEKSFDSQKTKDSAIAKKDSSIEKKKLEIQELENTIKNLANDTDFDAIFKKLKELGVNTEGIDKTRAGLEGIKKDLESLDENTLEEIREALNQMGVDAKDTDTKVDTLTQGVEQLGDTDKDLKRAENEMENLKNQVLQFFSLTNAVWLFKRTVQSALDTVKELDAVMTETAVVTDFTIGDMWEKLPQYSVQASALGVSIRDLYSATTLYYQQGLQTNEAMGVGTETMKMARIANMEATDATTAMTAALRGFNMEVNEMNAQRVNDVYSELAAITAADTNQIATAMGKTASIAASANMEFETTSALLAQIIETTQEAPETAGTAMKTIIARFTEVKELFSEGTLTGEDEEGEEININKIDAALKSVGISLKDFLNGRKGIDDIFLELASKWDTLDLATQRYIATTAAGSRQQSRFIAMMSNYDRTMELVNAANNSAGASQEQFNKTLDSLDAKLQQLNNAWDEFLMGLANNDIIKFGIDILTTLLNIVNGLTSALSGGNGLSKAIITLMVSIGALKVGGSVFKKVFSAEPVRQFIQSLKEIPDQAKKTGKQTAENLEASFKSRHAATTAMMAQEGLKDGAAYQEGFEKGRAGESLDGDNGQIPEQMAIPGFMDEEEGSSKQQKGSAPLEEPETPNSSPKAQGAFWSSAKGAYTASAIAGITSMIANYSAAAIESKNGSSAMAKGLEAAGATASVAASAFGLLAPAIAAGTISLGPLAIALGVATVAIGLVVAAVQAYKNASLEGRMEAAEKATKQAEDAATGAKQAYDALLNDRSEYNNLQTTLDNLVKGTNEWKQALADANAQVLALLEKYPQLAEYLERGEDGQLALNEAGWNELENQKLAGTYASSQNYYAKRSDELELSREVILEQAQDQFADAWVINVEGFEATDNTNAIFNEILKMLNENEDTSFEVFKERFSAYLGTDEDLKRAIAEVEIYRSRIQSEVEVQQDLLAEQQLQLSGQKLNLNEQQMDALNIVSQEYIDTEAENKKAEVLEGGIDTSEKIAYAGMANLTYNTMTDTFTDTEGNIIEVEDDLIASGVGLVQALDEIAKNVGAFANSFKNEDAFDFIANDGRNLTQAEINSLSAGSYSNEEKGELETYLGLDKGSFDTWFADKKGSLLGRFGEIEANKYIADNYAKITAMEGVSLNLGQAEKLETQIAQTQQHGAGNTLTSIYDTILNTVEDSNIPAVIDELLYVDPTDANSIENTLQALVDKGLIGADSIGVLTNELTKLSGVSRKINFDSAIEQLKESEDLIKNLKEREEHERTFNTQDKEALVARGANEADFVMTGADEWTYIGGTMESLISAVEANTAALLGDTKATIAEEADAARAWEAANGGKIDTTQGSMTTEEFFAGIAGGTLGLDDLIAGKESIKSIMALSGLSTEGLGNLTDQSQIDAATEIITEAFNKYGTETQRQAIYDEEEKVKSQVNQLEMSDMSGQEILSSTEYTNEEKQKSLDAKIATEEGLQQELESSTEALKEQNEAWENNSDVIKANIVDANTSKKKFDELNKVIEENGEALSDSNKGTKAYQKALLNVTEAAQEAFGNDEINEEFVESHKELFQQLAEGGETGANALQQIREAIVKETDVASGEITAVEEILQNLDGLTFDVNGRADFSQIFMQLAALMGSAEEAAAFMSKLGYSVTWEENGFTTMQIPDPRGNGRLIEVDVPNYTAVVTDAAGNSINGYTPSRGGGGGGGGSEETWENPYDKLYNLTREINEELRERERIERRYEKLLEKRLATAEQLSELSFSELGQLELEAELQREFISGRQQQIADLLAENPDMEQYFTVSTDENGKQVIRIDWDAINAVTDTEEGERIEEVLGKVEDWSDDIEDANDTLNDIEDTVFEIKERGKDEYMDLEDQIKEALTQVYQGEIDKLSDINDSINDTNSRLLDAVQRSIDEQRQERENAKTEEELSDKRSRLAYLQQDTSGANALEILKLQEEIAQGEEDYTDSLIDQKISELQRQNDEAAAQREQQINIAQAQLDHYIETGAIWQEVYSLMTSGLNEKTGLIRGSRLEEVLQKAENFSGLSAIGKMEWLKDLETNIASALSYLRVGRQIEDLGITSGQISFTTKDGKTLTGTVDSSGNVTTSDGKVFDDVYQGSNGFYYSNKTEAEGTVKKPESPAPATPVVTKKTNPYGNASETTGLIYEGMTGTQVKSIQWALKEMGYDIGAEGIDGVYGWATKRAVTQFQTDFHREHPNERMSTPDGIVGPNTRNAFRIKQYKTGGLADFTGPAWLDGTKSRPEYILNADQTRAFFELVDVLSALKTNSSITTQNSGDNTYDIDINVESIGSDYDVEQLANTVKRLINDDARYRNNNIAGHTR